MAKVNDRDDIQVKKSAVSTIANETLAFKRDVLRERLNDYVGKYFIISLKGSLELIGGKIVEIKYDEFFNQNVFHIQRATDQSIRGIPVMSISNFENNFNNEDEVISKLDILYKEQLARKGSYYLTDLGVFFVSSLILENLEYYVIPVQRLPSRFLDAPLSELTKKASMNDLVEYRKYSNFFSYVLINEVSRIMLNLIISEYIEPVYRKYISYVLSDLINDVGSVQMDRNYKEF